MHIRGLTRSHQSVLQRLPACPCILSGKYHSYSPQRRPGPAGMIAASKGAVALELHFDIQKADPGTLMAKRLILMMGEGLAHIYLAI